MELHFGPQEPLDTEALKKEQKPRFWGRFQHILLAVYKPEFKNRWGIINRALGTLLKL
jgi:hypothetical protein